MNEKKAPDKKFKWIKSKYFQIIGTRKWVSRDKDEHISLLKSWDGPD